MRKEFLSLFVFLSFSTICLAQQLAPPKVKIVPNPANPNDKVKLIISIPLTKGLHIYGPNVKEPYFATKAFIKEQGKQSPIIWNPKPLLPKTTILNVMGENIDVIAPDKDNEVKIIFTGKVKPSAKSGKYKIPVVLTYQACSETTCLQPIANKELTGNILIGAPASTSSVVSRETATGLKVSLLGHSFELTKTNMLLAFAIAFIAGLILNIMPCVLPIIPLKILQLVDQAKREKHSAVGLSLIFGIGIIAFFIAIGIFAIILKGSFSWGMQFQHIGFVVAMILLLLWLTMGMFGVFEIALPGFIANRPIMKSGYPGAFMMGFLGGILSTPCSFGILGAAVAWAQLQPPVVTLIVFFLIGLGMACPYIILSAFPGLAERIPKAGRWTELFKQSMGFLLLGVVAFLINALPKDNLFWFLLYFILFSFVVWVWGSVLRYSTGILPAGLKLAGVILLLYTGFYLLKPTEIAPTSAPGAFSEAALKQALSEGKIVAVKFTADWCISCKVVEARVYHNKDVLKLIEDDRLVVLKADLTRPNPFVLKKLKEWTGQSGVPFTVLFYPDGRKKLFSGKFSPEEFIKSVKMKN